jgi:5S rRNA maturation endonuclease (ribonuclease M5)
MRAESIKQFLEALGIDRIYMHEERGWVNTKCPLAPYVHSGGSDTRPSFGISISPDGPSVWWCFGCSSRGLRLGWLLHSLWVADGRYPKQAARIYAREELAKLPETEEKDVEAPDRWARKAPEQVEPLPLTVLKRYPLLQGRADYEARRIRQWLIADRGVEEWVQNACGLRYHADNQSVIFPLTDVRGDVFLLRERNRKEKRMWQVSPDVAGFPELDFPRLRDVGVWFGMHMIDWTNPVMLVEGEIDAMRLMSLGFLNVIASAGSSVTEAQIDALAASTLILGYDADKGGQFAHNRITDRLKGRVSLFLADWSLAMKDSASACKDAGDLPDREALSLVLSDLETV